METNTRIFCKGEECSVKHTCLRYTRRNSVTSCVGGYSVIRKCTQQKRYIQDESKVNKDGENHR